MTRLLSVPSSVDWVSHELGLLSKVEAPRLGALGHGPAQGDGDCSLLVRHLSYEVDAGRRSRDSLGIAWLHEVPYFPRHPHLARLLQESISEARQIRCETGLSELTPNGSLVRGGRESRAFALARKVAKAGATDPLFIVVAQDARKAEGVEIVRRELSQVLEAGKLALLGTSGTINTIAQSLWKQKLASGWKPHELRLDRLIKKSLTQIWQQCATKSLNLIQLGTISGAGDIDVAYYVRAMGALENDNSHDQATIWTGMIWLHSLPYESARVHYNLFLQECLTTANIPYATSPDGALALLNDLKNRPPSLPKAILALTADDSMKPTLRFIVREARKDLLSDKVVVVATYGTGALLRDLAERGFP